VLAPAIDGADGSAEIALVGPLTAALVEATWLAGDGAALPALAARALALAGDLGHRTTGSELVRYLQRAGHPAGVVADPVGPWAPGIAGDWQAAADAWAARGNRYERALELALAPDPAARTEGRHELEALRADGALAILG
jgi:hypothetical protein